MNHSDKLSSLLRTTECIVSEDVLTRIRQSNYFAQRLIVVDSVADAVALYSEAERIPQTSTKVRVREHENVQIGDVVQMSGTQAIFLSAFESDLPKLLKIPMEVTNNVDDECRFYVDNAAAAANEPLVPVRVLEMQCAFKRQFSPNKVLQKGVLMPRYASSLCENPIPLSAAYALACGQRILRALQCMHRCGYLHGDVKPGNIFVDHMGAAWLGDYGSSVKFASLKIFLGGTPRYQCSEVSPDAGVKFDFMGLALTLLEKLGVLKLAHSISVANVKLVKEAIEKLTEPGTDSGSSQETDDLANLRSFLFDELM